jgi:hypothetical protein
MTNPKSVQNSQRSYAQFPCIFGQRGLTAGQCSQIAAQCAGVNSKTIYQHHFNVGRSKRAGGPEEVGPYGEILRFCFENTASLPLPRFGGSLAFVTECNQLCQQLYG